MTWRLCRHPILRLRPGSPGSLEPRRGPFVSHSADVRGGTSLARKPTSAIGSTVWMVLPSEILATDIDVSCKPQDGADDMRPVSAAVHVDGTANPAPPRLEAALTVEIWMGHIYPGVEHGNFEVLVGM